LQHSELREKGVNSSEWRAGKSLRQANTIWGPELAAGLRPNYWDENWARLRLIELRCVEVRVRSSSALLRGSVIFAIQPCHPTHAGDFAPCRLRVSKSPCSRAALESKTQAEPLCSGNRARAAHTESFMNIKPAILIERPVPAHSKKNPVN